MILKKVSVKELKEKPFSLVLSGGAALGIAHIGVIKFLEENNLYPEEVLGTSMGALIGALYSIGKTSDELINLINQAEKIKLFKLKIKRENLEYSVLNNFLKNIFKDLKMKDALVNLKLTATEVTSGDGRVFSKDDNVLILDVVRASISLPGIFSFKKIEDKYYMDGGIFSNLPIEYAKKENIKVSSNVVNRHSKVNYIGQGKFLKKLKFNLKVYEKLLTYLMKNQTYSKTEYIDKICLIEPDLSKQKRYSFDNFSKTIELGYEAAKSVISID